MACSCGWQEPYERTSTYRGPKDGARNWPDHQRRAVAAALRATDVPLHTDPECIGNDDPAEHGMTERCSAHNCTCHCHRATDVPSWREASRRLHASGDDEPYV